MVDILDALAGLVGKQEVRTDYQPKTAEAKGRSRGERNNNPGNLEDGPFTRSQPGYQGSDGRFARFATPQHGEAAQENLLRNGKRYRGKPISQLIQIYAPPGDNSDASIRNYIGYVAARAGVDPDGTIPPEKYGTIAAAMREFETGNRGNVRFQKYGGRVGSGTGKPNGAGGSYNADKPGIGVADPAAYLADLESKLAPEVAASGGVTQQAQATFGSDAELRTRADAVEKQIESQGTHLDVLDQTMQVAQAASREAMTRQIEQTRDISNEIVAGTQELKAKVIPVFAARARIADQLDRTAQMNPLERGLRGIFDLDYDQKHLTRQLEVFDRTLEMRSRDFDYLNNLQAVALNEIQRRYTMDTSIPALMQKQAEEDLGLVGMRITQTAGMLGNLRDRITTESQVIGAKAVARQDLLGRLDLPTVTNLMNQAQANNGIVQFNGAEFSYKELRDRLQAGERQELDTESYRMAIAGGRMDMAGKYADNLAQSLTRGQLEAAIQNGGVHNGVQLKQDVLASLYQTAVSRDETRAEVAGRSMPASLALKAGSDYMTQTVNLYNRARGLFGSQVMEGSTAAMERGAMLVQKLVAATEAGAPPETISVLTQQIAQNTQEHQKFIEDRILQSVGGDKRAAGYMRGFVFGAELSPGTAAEAMTYFAMKGNLPDGITLSPETQQVFRLAQKEVELGRQQAPGGKKLTESALALFVQRRVTEQAGAIMGRARHDQLYESLPAVSRAAGHPFGKFPAQRWAEIRSESQMTAAESIAAAVSTTPQNVLTMLRTGKPLEDTPESKELMSQVQKQAANYNAVEMQTMVRLLDREAPVVSGRSNSSIMTEFLGSPQMTGAASTHSRSLGSQSIGEYLANPLVAGQTEKRIADTRQLALDAQAAVNGADRQLAQNPATNMLFRPVTRTQMILKAIPGIGQEGVQALTPFVRDYFRQYTAERAASGVNLREFETPNQRFLREDAALYAALLATKFGDPKLETYRKKALQGWQENATQQQGFMQNMMDLVTADVDLDERDFPIGEQPRVGGN